MRFKTEGEFLAEFGRTWREILPSWVSDMDVNFGRQLSPKDSKEMAELIYKRSCMCEEELLLLPTIPNIKIGGFSVSSWMILQDVNSVIKQCIDLDATLSVLYDKFSYTNVATSVLLKARDSLDEDAYNTK